MAAGVVEVARFGKPRARLRQVDFTEALVRADGKLERGAFQMIDENLEIVRLDERVFGRIAEEIVRVADDELIERRRGSDQHGAGAARAAAGAAGALPGRSDRAGIAGEHGGVERADVDAELERAGRDHTANAALAEAALDLASFTGEVAAAIAANRLRLRRRMWIGLFEISQQEFRVQAAVGENNGLQVAFQKFLRHA